MFEYEQMLDGSTKAMQVGEKVSSIIIALAKADASKALQHNDIASLKDADEFLKSIIRGVKWVEDPIVSGESKKYALDFETARQPWRQSWGSPPTSEEFVGDVGTMQKTVNSIMKKGSFDPIHLQKTRKFFNLIFRASINRFGMTPPPPKFPRANV